MKATITALVALAAASILWVWRGERWALRAFEEGIAPHTITDDSADTYEEGMEMAMTAGSGTEWVRESQMDATRTGLWD